LARRALADGSSAARQRRVMRMSNNLFDVVDHLIAETADIAPRAQGALGNTA
jgi:carboxylate-amine ligase